MRWIKLGRIFAPENNHSWMTSHASNPVAEPLHDDVFRIYFSCRDADNRSHIGCVDVELFPPFKILEISEEPLLAPGQVGTFDDSGVSVASLRIVRGKKYLYYVGWNLGVTVPWRNSIGLAIYNASTGTFERYSKAPLLDRHEVDPFSISYPFILEDGGIYRMWYGSNLSWGKDRTHMVHVIKYAESRDALHWHREGIIALDFKHEDEKALTRPSVTKDRNHYAMWYSYRGGPGADTYRIGYAESIDGISWARKDEAAGIERSDSGWDCEMIEYPHVFDHNGKRYMLYNGNGFGKTGFGLAELADSC